MQEHYYDEKRRYTTDFKLNLVLEYINSESSFFEISKKAGIHRSVLMNWVAIYKKKGALGLDPPKDKKHYTIDFKLKVLNYINSKQVSLSVACEKFKIPYTGTISLWQKKYYKDSLLGLHLQSNHQPVPMSLNRKKIKIDKSLTKEELLLEIERLQCENDLLKKLKALTQTKKKHKP
ncbi:transposase [Elizabethkingia anophelis]|uniref:transposase n=1 Tax=Elizabethkingia anophelis TaxID=1117645 RepID=UPI00320B9CDE